MSDNPEYPEQGPGVLNLLEPPDSLDQDLSEEPSTFMAGSLTSLQVQEIGYVKPEKIVPQAFKHCPYCHEGEIKRKINFLSVICLFTFLICIVGLLFLLCLYEHRCTFCGAVVH